MQDAWKRPRACRRRPRARARTPGARAGRSTWLSTSAASSCAAAAAARSERTRSPATTSVRESPAVASASPVLRQPVQGREEELGLRHTIAARRPVAYSGGDHGAGARLLAVGLGMGGVARGGEQVGAAQHRLHGVAQVVVDQLRGPGDHDDLGAGGEVGAVQDAQAGVAWRNIAGVPITKAVLPRRCSASTCCIAPPTVTTSRSEARRPSRLGDQVLAGLVRVVGGEDEPLAGVAQLRQRVDGARGGLPADPDAAVEVEDELVVAGGERRERHLVALSIPAAAAVRRSPR